MKNRILGVLLVSIMLISTSISAQNPRQEDRPRRWNNERIDRDLKPRGERESFFTDEQKEKINELRLETAQKVKPLQNELGELQAKQQTLTTKENADLDAIYKNIEEISNVRTEMAKIMAKQNQEIRAMLTEEQLLKYDAMKKRQLGFHQDFNERTRMGRFDRQRSE